MNADPRLAPDAARQAVPWGAPRFETGGPRTVAQLEAVVRAAREEGYAEGRAQGYADGRGEAERLAERYAALIESLSQPLAQLDEDVEAALADLACAIARAACRTALERDDALYAALVREALAAAGSEARAVELRLHPDDMARGSAAVAAIEGPRPRLVADPELKPGDVRVHAESLRIDGTLDARLAAAARALRRAP